MTTEIYYLKQLQNDEDFVDYCKKEIHEIIKEGRIDASDIHNIVNIILYIVDHQEKHIIPKDVFCCVVQAFIIEVLKKYNIDLTNLQYEHLLKILKSLLLQRIV